MRRIVIAASDENDERRLNRLIRWLASFEGLESVVLRPASVDASFRRYFRVRQGEVSRIVMDAPPAQEDCRPFVKIAGYLENMGLNGPRVLEADFENGFLLLTDLGTRQYMTEVAELPGSASALYADAVDALLILQRKGELFQDELPLYDDARLFAEMQLFRDWLCQRHLDLVFSEQDEVDWQECCSLLVDNALQQEKVFVHRDYHSRNLMFDEQHNPGILDFQDAVLGPLTYDLVSLLKDCYIKWPADWVLQWVHYFYNQLSYELKASLSEAEFLRQFELMGVQRQLKASGIFARLLHRDGKPGYMNDVPRTLRYIVEIAPKYQQLTALSDLISQRVLPGLEALESGEPTQ